MQHFPWERYNSWAKFGKTRLGRAGYRQGQFVTWHEVKCKCNNDVDADACLSIDVLTTDRSMML